MVNRIVDSKAENCGFHEKKFPVPEFGLPYWDHYTFLGNCPPTPPLSQHLGQNGGLGEG